MPSVSYKSRRPAADHRPAGGRAALGQALLPATARRHRVADGRTPARAAAERALPVYSGTLTRLAGWLGAFDAEWTQDNPIDLDLCTRCNACVARAPNTRSTGLPGRSRPLQGAPRRASPRAASSAPSISTRSDTGARASTSIWCSICSRAPDFAHAPAAAGLFRAGRRSDRAGAGRGGARATMVGEFEKPKFFAYKASICAHSRSRKDRLHAMHRRLLDVRHPRRRRPRRVEPHLCMGCGACTTVCPSGALSYAYPSVARPGARMSTLLAHATRSAGGRDAVLLLHAEDGREASSSDSRGAGAACRRASCRSRSSTSPRRHRPVAGRDRAGRRAGRGARHRQRGAAVPRALRARWRSREAIAAGARLPGRAFRA